MTQPNPSRESLDHRGIWLIVNKDIQWYRRECLRSFLNIFSWSQRLQPITRQARSGEVIPSEQLVRYMSHVLRLALALITAPKLGHPVAIVCILVTPSPFLSGMMGILGKITGPSSSPFKGMLLWFSQAKWGYFVRRESFLRPGRFA